MNVNASIFNMHLRILANQCTEKNKLSTSDMKSFVNSVKSLNNNDKKFYSDENIKFRNSQLKLIKDIFAKQNSKAGQRKINFLRSLISVSVHKDNAWHKSR